MKKNIIAMAVAAAVAAPAAAMADTTLYGKIHASYDFYDGDNANDHDYSFSTNSSRLGIKGKEDVSDNLAFIYQWETTIAWGDDGNIGGGRNTFVGFTGENWGTVIAGRHDTPFKQVSRKYDLFGDTIGDSRNVLGGITTNDDGDVVSQGWDRRLNNMVAYATPDMGGFSAMAGYVSDVDSDTNNEADAYSMKAGYEIAGFSIDGAYEKVNAANGDDADAMRLGAGYKIGGFKLVGLYQTIEDFDGNDRDAWGLGAGYTFAGKHTIKGQWYAADDVDNTNDTGADLWAVGYDYKISKQTSVYAAYAAVDADANSPETIGNGGHGANTDTIYGFGEGVTGSDSSSFSVGVVHKF